MFVQYHRHVFLFLLGVFDGNRMGGLRFKREMDGPFLDDNKQYAVPAWTSLRELAQISLRLEQEEAINDFPFSSIFQVIPPSQGGLTASFGFPPKEITTSFVSPTF